MTRKNNFEKYLVYAIVAVSIVFVVVYWFPEINIGIPASLTPYNPPTYNPPTYPTPEYPDYPSSTTDVRAPTSLYVTIEPNPVMMTGWVYGNVVGDGYKYPIMIHAKHVGEGTESTFSVLLDEDGEFSHSQTMDVAGYWDFWATSDSVTSNTPRLQVQGAMLTSSKVFMSRTMSDMVTTLKLYCHSSGSASIFANDPDAGVSIPMTTVHINSGGYAETTFDFSSWSLGNYELDFVVNGIKASDYGKSVWITLGR